MDKRYRWKIITVIVLSVLVLSGLTYLTFFSKKMPLQKEEVAAEVTPTPTPTPTATPMPTPEPTPEPPKVDLDSSDSIQRIVNPMYPLTADYVPSDLVEFPGTNTDHQMLRKEASDQLKLLFDAAKENNAYLRLVSGYRSYQLQKDLESFYKQKYGEAYTVYLDCHPGVSEHQLGLAVDLGVYYRTCELQRCFQDYPVFQWLKDHAHEYGWILRYPEGKQEITKQMYAPWHFRYIGVEEATKLHESGLTMEEYYQRSAS